MLLETRETPYTLKLIFIHIREELQELQDGPSSPSTHSIMLSMGEDFVDKEERSHGVKIITVATIR